MVKVSIVKGENPRDITVRALDMIRAKDGLAGDRAILIKPNYINAKHPSTGITTDSRVIEGVVKYIKQSGLNKVILGLKRVKIAKTALESRIVSVPKLKIHAGAGVTLSIKNMMGVMTPKGSMHRGNLSKNIADLASLVKPSLAVVDGIIAAEGHETNGSPVEMNLVLAGKDPVAVDAVGAAVMGVPARSVRHLIYAEQRGLGTYDLGQIEVVGEPIENVKKVFRR